MSLLLIPSGFTANLSETINSWDDNLATQAALTVALSESLALSEALALATTYGLVLSEAVDLTDSLGAVAAYIAGLSDSLSLSDTLSTGGQSLDIEDAWRCWCDALEVVATTSGDVGDEITAVDPDPEDPCSSC